MRQTEEYKPLPASTDDSEIELIRPKSMSKSITVTLISIVVVLLLSMLVTLRIHSDHYRQESSLDCGSSRQEALAMGCKFDPMSFSWLQPDCYDSELTSQFLTLRQWRWTTDRAGSDEVSFDDVMKGKHELLYVSWEYHLLHCTYMWRKMHRAVLAGKRVDGYIGNYNHTSHCEKMLMENTALDEINTIIRTKFVTCK